MHAVAVNSATSGLLVSCMAARVGWGDEVVVSPYTMSATAAVPSFLGANVVFGDIDPQTFCLRPDPDLVSEYTKAIIVTNLFGHPGPLTKWRKILEGTGIVLIEDAAQSILATRNGKHLQGDIAVYSGNIHKAVQCGEGGMCVTQDDNLAERMRMARNHGELAGLSAGLNLRLTEVCAAIWYEQLKKADWIVSQRIEIANALSEAAKEVGWIPPYVEPGCVHSFYIWAMRHPNRDWIVDALQAEGFPCQAGYVMPLYKLPAFKQDISLPVTEQVESEIICYENCAWTPTVKQLKQIREAFKKVADAVCSRTEWGTLRQERTGAAVN